MRRKQFTPEKVIGLLRQAGGGEVELAQGKRVGEVCRGLGHLGAELLPLAQSVLAASNSKQARRMKDLEKETGG